MSKFDERIVSWRKEMSAAGIGAGPLRDELECHLRDAFDARVSSGMNPEVAFTEAAAKLGAPKSLRQEYDAAVSRWTRVKRFLGRRVELFPTDMRICAWAAIPAGVYDAYSAIQAVYANRIFFAEDTLAAGHYSGLVFIGSLCVCLLLIGLVGLQSGLHYLRRPAYAPARKLAFFWVCNTWFYGVLLLMLIRAVSNGSYNDNGTPIASNLPTWPLVLTIAVALVSYYDWAKRLRGVSAKPVA